jgi:triosephosphate isomerase
MSSLAKPDSVLSTSLPYGKQAARLQIPQPARLPQSNLQSFGHHAAMTNPKNASTPRPLVAGNWKMNGVKAALSEAIAVRDFLVEHDGEVHADVMICPPATLLMVMAEVVGARVHFGGQDCHTAPSGAHTGDIAAGFLADAGADAVIVGHSERRADHGETDRLVRQKSEAAHRAGLTAIVCVGETQGQRDAGLTRDVVRRQLAGSLPEGVTAQNTVIAYEPVWAIGTGLTPTVADVEAVHADMRAELVGRFPGEAQGIRLLYGGSVKPSNAAELMAVANVDGALVGGASLKAEDFTAIIAALPARSAS